MRLPRIISKRALKKLNKGKYWKIRARYNPVNDNWALYIQIRNKRVGNKTLTLPGKPKIFKDSDKLNRIALDAVIKHRDEQEALYREELVLTPAQILQRREDEERAQITFREVVERYVLWKKVRPKNHKNLLAKFKQFRGENFLMADITPELITGFIRFLEKTLKSKATARVYLNVFKTIIGYALDEGYIENDPRKKKHMIIETTEEEQTRLKARDSKMIISDSTASLLLKYLNQTHDPILAGYVFALFHGARYSQICALTEDFLHSEVMADGTLQPYIFFYQTKTGKPVKIYLTDFMQDFIEKYNIFDWDYPSQRVRRRLGKIAKELNVPRFTFHSSRHYARTISAKQNTEAVTNAIIGHSDSSVSGNYTHIDGKPLLDGIKAIENHILKRVANMEVVVNDDHFERA